MCVERPSTSWGSATTKVPVSGEGYSCLHDLTAGGVHIVYRVSHCRWVSSGRVLTPVPAPLKKDTRIRNAQAKDARSALAKATSNQFILLFPRIPTYSVTFFFSFGYGYRRAMLRLDADTSRFLFRHALTPRPSCRRACTAAVQRCCRWNSQPASPHTQTQRVERDQVQVGPERANTAVAITC